MTENKAEGAGEKGAAERRTAERRTAERRIKERKREKREERLSLVEKVSEVFDVPGEVIAGLPRITITGYGKLIVENHRGILEYSYEKISVNGGKAVIEVVGQGLELRAMNDRELLITGRIRGVEFTF